MKYKKRKKKSKGTREKRKNNGTNYTKESRRIKVEEERKHIIGWKNTIKHNFHIIIATASISCFVAIS